MYYRRRLLMGLLQAVGGEAERLRFQKLLLLLNAERDKAVYHFVPFKFGAFSFQSTSDLGTLGTYGLVRNDESTKRWRLLSTEDHVAALRPEDAALLKRIAATYGKLGRDELVHETYRRFPYTAIRSEMAPRLLSAAEKRAVEQARPKPGPVGLYSIGYEGLDLDSFLNKLLGAGIAVLCDVRRNAFSMKYGFSKKQLAHACEGLGIRYVHVPEVGIASEQRQELSSAADYAQLFKRYEQESLPNTGDAQDRIIDLIEQHERVAIMCFEHEVGCCHRGPLAKAIALRERFSGEVVHL